MTIEQRIAIYRADGPSDGGHSDDAGGTAYELLDEAADTITALRAELEEAKSQRDFARESLVQKYRQYERDMAAMQKSLNGEIEQLASARNALRDALAWFESHEVEKKLGHLPQWVAALKPDGDGK